MSSPLNDTDNVPFVAILVSPSTPSSSAFGPMDAMKAMDFVDYWNTFLTNNSLNDDGSKWIALPLHVAVIPSRNP